jgi:hypothetical protein
MLTVSTMTSAIRAIDHWGIASKVPQ